jgi:energy-coupling factor transporter ATP-binding protein EcfA2
MKSLLNYIPLFLAFMFALGGIPAYKYLFDVTHNTTTSVILTIVYEVVVFVFSFMTKVWERLEGKWADRLADRIDLTLQTLFSGFRSRYLEYVVYQHRVFDVKGLTTQGPYSLELERVYVQLSLDPTSVHQVSSNPLPDSLHTGSHTIWDYIGNKNIENTNRNYAVLGAPGSGKTTLLKHMALTVASPAHRRKKAGAPDLLPILLFLREHAQSIIEDPDKTLAQLIRNQFESRHAPVPPIGWLERQIERGNCLIMLDGLDEIADAETRKIVVSWVEQCMVACGKNWYVLSSRPFGYKSNPLANVTVLEIRPFTSKQQEEFVRNWYLANELISFQKDDPGVREEARSGAEDLLERLRSSTVLADLAINPLLLTMIATVHRYRSSLPGRRVELYAEICEVFLGKRQEARGLHLDLTPAQKTRVLQQLAYAMMEKEIRVIDQSEAVSLVTELLTFVDPKAQGYTFLQEVENSSGLLVEYESGSYSFSHLTFQEYLSSLYIIETKLENELAKQVENPWWRETILLYCAQSDASNIIEACLSSTNTSTLSLAIECMGEAREVNAITRDRYQKMMDKGLEDPDSEKRKVIAAAFLEHRLH